MVYGSIIYVHTIWNKTLLLHICIPNSIHSQSHIRPPQIINCCSLQAVLDWLSMHIDVFCLACINPFFRVYSLSALTTGTAWGLLEPTVAASRAAMRRRASPLPLWHKNRKALQKYNRKLQSKVIAVCVHTHVVHWAYHIHTHSTHLYSER